MSISHFMQITCTTWHGLPGWSGWGAFLRHPGDRPRRPQRVRAGGDPLWYSLSAKTEELPASVLQPFPRFRDGSVQPIFTWRREASVRVDNGRLGGPSRTLMGFSPPLSSSRGSLREDLLFCPQKLLHGALEVMGQHETGMCTAE